MKTVSIRDLSVTIVRKNPSTAFWILLSTKNGKRIWGLYSETETYMFSWGPEELEMAGEEILRDKCPEIRLEEKLNLLTQINL